MPPALRSLFLSAAVTACLSYSLTFGLTDPHSFLKRLPNWSAVPLLVVAAMAYLLAAWWAFRGFRAHKITALVSLGFCSLGFAVYAGGIAMELGKGKAAQGQYDPDFSTLDPGENAALEALVKQAGLGLSDAVFTEHWHLAEPAKGFRICVQKGHVTALNFANHPVPDLGLLSRLPQLGDLSLQNCGLSDLSALRSTRLDRLDISQNKVSDLKTLAGCPNLQWLTARDNAIHSTAGIEQFSALVSSDFTGNPLP